MKDKDNVLRWLDEVDNAIMILDRAVEMGSKIDPVEARSRFRTIRQKLKVITDRVTGS
mgnify:CR=1 FL=1